MKKIIPVFLSLTMVATTVSPAFAIQKTDYHSSKKAKVGYTEIYNDGANGPIGIKPSSVPDTIYPVTFTASEGEQYSFKIIDLFDNVIASKSGVAIGGEETVKITIPHNAKSGDYKIIGKIGSKIETVDKITIQENLALNADIKVEGSSGNKANLNDITIANFIENGGSSGNKQDVELNPKPVITYEFGEGETRNVDYLEVYSGEIGRHEPTEFKLSYVNKNDEIIEVGNFRDLQWEKYYKDVEARKKTVLEFEDVQAKKLILEVVKSNQQWGNKYSIDEIMVWGNEESKKYQISLGQNIGAENFQNTIVLTGKSVDNLLNKKVSVKLVKDSKIICDKETSFNNGVLSYQFYTPQNIESGNYKVVITSDDGTINESIDYIVRESYSYESNIDDYLKIKSGKENVEGAIDNDYTSSSELRDIKILNKSEENNQLFYIRSMKVYADKGAFDSAELLLATNARSDAKFESVSNMQNLSWQKDENGDYIEFYITGNYVSHAYELKLNKTAQIKEIEIVGVYLEENLLSDAQVTYNGENIDSYNMFDNVITSATEISAPSDRGELDIKFKDGNIREISQLVIASNFPEKQGLKEVEVSYFQDGEWITLDETIIPKYIENKEQRRQLCVIDLPHIQTTNIKLKTTFNKQWNKGVITELNIIGKKYESAKAMAALIDHVDEVSASTGKVTLTWLEEVDVDYSDKYTYQIVSSSKENVIDLDGNIYHGDKVQESVIKFKVSDKNGNEYLTEEINVTVPEKLEDGYKGADLKVDKTTAYKNPAMGWVAYVEGFECVVHDEYDDGDVTNPNAQNKGLCMEINNASDADMYWKEIDDLVEQGMPINILYIREPWSWFEPQEGKYAWEDKNSACYALIEGAKERNIQLAFRVLTCSASCEQQATPQWVFDAGAKFTNVNATAYIGKTNEPYLDHPVFIEKFENFVNALASKFDNEGTAFIDAHGHGEWGEMNARMYSDSNMNETVKRLQKVYEDAFNNVLLGGQLGSSQGGQTIRDSFDIDGSNFVVRRDAFGSDKYLNPDKSFIRELRNKGVPLFAENCYHHFESRDFRWSTIIDFPDGGGQSEYGGDDPFVTMDAMMNKVVYDAIDLGANTIDLRTLEDAKLWVKDGMKYLNKFTQEGGYRISVTDAVYNSEVVQGEDITIYSTWQNNGAGIVPNKNIKWGNKFKVSYALIDNEGKIVQQFNESTDKINVGDFEKGNDYDYETSFRVEDDIANGQYKLAVSIVNEKDSNNPGIELANAGEKVGGWLTLGSVQVGEKANIETVVRGEGSISFDKEDIYINDTVTLKVNPADGYEVGFVKVNGKLVELKDSMYVIDNVENNTKIEVLFEKKHNQGENEKPTNPNDNSGNTNSNDNQDIVNTGDVSKVGHITLISLVSLIGLATLTHKSKKKVEI